MTMLTMKMMMKKSSVYFRYSTRYYYMRVFLCWLTFLFGLLLQVPPFFIVYYYKLSFSDDLTVLFMVIEFLFILLSTENVPFLHRTVCTRSIFIESCFRFSSQIKSFIFLFTLDYFIYSLILMLSVKRHVEGWLW